MEYREGASQEGMISKGRFRNTELPGEKRAKGKRGGLLRHVMSHVSVSVPTDLLIALPSKSRPWFSPLSVGASLSDLLLMSGV